MGSHHPLTLTVEQAGQVLGVGRSTAYELARSGDLKCIRLRRRIVIPVAHLADRLGVDRDAVWTALANAVESDPPSPAGVAEPTGGSARRLRPSRVERPSLF